MDQKFISNIEHVVTQSLLKLKDPIVQAILKERDNPDVLNATASKVEKIVLDTLKRFESTSSSESSDEEIEEDEEPPKEHPSKHKEISAPIEEDVVSEGFDEEPVEEPTVEEPTTVEEEEEEIVEQPEPSVETESEVVEEEVSDASRAATPTSPSDDFDPKKLPRDANEVPAKLRFWAIKTENGAKVLNLDTTRSLTPASVLKNKKQLKYQTTIETNLGTFSFVSKFIDFNKSKNWQTFLKLIPKNSVNEPIESLTDITKKIIQANPKIKRNKISKTLLEGQIVHAPSELSAALKQLIDNGEIVSDKDGYSIVQ
jgi:hypothetical protein